MFNYNYSFVHKNKKGLILPVVHTRLFFFWGKGPAKLFAKLD